MEKEFYVTDDLLASQGQRFANYIIDFISQLTLFFLLIIVLQLIYIVLESESSYMFENLNGIQEYLIGAVLIIVYYIPFELLSSRTIGKYITRTIVVTENGIKPTSRQLIKRNLCRIIPFDAFSFLGSPCHGWHDSLSDTYVVKKQLLEEEMKLFYSLEEIGTDIHD